MNVLASALLVALKQMPVFDADVSRPDEKSSQLEHIAIATATAVNESVIERRWRGDLIDLAALTLAIGRAESGWSLDVGACIRWNNKARGLWQVEHSPAWLGLAPKKSGWCSGDDPTLLQARGVVRMLEKSWQCGGTPRGWLTAYRGVSGDECNTPNPRAPWSLNKRLNMFWSARTIIVNELYHVRTREEFALVIKDDSSGRS